MHVSLFNSHNLISSKAFSAVSTIIITVKDSYWTFENHLERLMHLYNSSNTRIQTHMALACIQATATYQNTKVHINQGYTQLLELSQVWNWKYLGRKHDNDNEKSTKLQKNKRPESTIEQQQLITFTLKTTLYTCLLVRKRIVAQQYPSILPMHTHTHFLYCQKPEKMRKCWKMTKPDNNSKDYQWFSCMWKCVLFNAQQQCQPQQQPPFSFQLLYASSLFTIDSAIVYWQ